MKRDLAALARVFTAVYGAPLDDARTLAALEAVFEAERAQSLKPSPNEIRARRLENIARPIFAALERERGVTREQLVTHPGGAPGAAVPAVDEAAWRLHRAGLSIGALALVLNRARPSVRDAVRRHEARLRAGVVVQVEAIGVAARRPEGERRVARAR